MDIPTNEDIANELVSQALDEMDVERIVKAARDGSGSMSLVYLAEVIARSLDTESLDYFINQLGAEALSKTNDETRTDDNIGGRIEVGSDEVR